MSLKKDFFLAKMLSIDLSEDTLKALAIYLKTYENDYKTIIKGLKYVYNRSSIHYRLIIYLLIDKLTDLEISNEMMEELKLFVNENLTDFTNLDEKHEYFRKRIDGLLQSLKQKGF